MKVQIEITINVKITDIIVKILIINSIISIIKSLNNNNLSHTKKILKIKSLILVITKHIKIPNIVKIISKIRINITSLITISFNQKTIKGKNLTIIQTI
jgi:hypothetical protein